MTELEHALVALGAQLELPEAPDLVPRVRARLQGRPRRSWRPALVVALAVLALGLAAALAVPSARSSILRFFHIGGATVERVDTLPPARERPLTAGLGAPVSLAEAERRAGFELLLPPLAGGKPDRVYVRDGLIAALLAAPHGHKPILLAQFRGSDFGILKKTAGPSTQVEPVQVNGRDGIWLVGGPHVLSYIDPQGRFQQHETRLAGNTLLWLRDGFTLRLEGLLTKAEALRLARATR